MSQFPLFLHATGQWAKKVRGRTVYFGKDKAEALAKWLREKEDLLAGREPQDELESVDGLESLERFLASEEFHDAILQAWERFCATSATTRKKDDG